MDQAHRRAVVRMASHEESVAKTTSMGVRATISQQESMSAHADHVRERLNWLMGGEASVEPSADAPGGAASEPDAPGHLNTHK